MKRTRRFAAALVMLALTAATHPAAAAWPHEPNNGNVAVCTATCDQSSPTSVSDGAGGAIFTWYDCRSGNYDIYVQHINAAGNPQWTADGVALCAEGNTQLYPAIVSDGVGGAVVSWLDYRGGTADIYAQRIFADGMIEWAANGVAVCTAAGDQEFPAIAEDGANGAIVTWVDRRGGAYGDIYAQRVDKTGDLRWSPGGEALCRAAYDQVSPMIAADGAGGAIVAWQDGRTGASPDIYAQRIDTWGATQWAADGVAACNAMGGQEAPRIVPDGAGGAIITWQDGRSLTTWDIYAQRYTTAGASLWTANGVVVCNSVGQQTAPTIASDGAGGAIVTWYDDRSGTSDDIYAQRISAAGVNPWAANGVALCTASGEQVVPTIASDGAGGAIVTWHDDRNGNYDIYAQRISSIGAQQWIWDGVALCAAVSGQFTPAIASDGAGGAIVAWNDFRSGTGYDIYAQRIERFGQLGNPEPAIAGVKDVKNDQGGQVKLSWSASYLDADPVYGVFDYRIWRSVPQAALTARGLLEQRATRDADQAASRGCYLLQPYAGTDYAWELVGTQPAGILPSYSLTTTTTSDSIAAGNPRTAFMVEARAVSSVWGSHWFSSPDSGYSVDNLPPAVPAPFTGQYAAGTAHLHWDRNVEPDLAGYRLYRGTSVVFTPGPANLVGALPDTGYTYAAGAPYVYKLTAIDSHGNESPVATLVPSGTLGVADASSPALSFGAPSPNPAHGATTLDYALSRAGHVRLAVYDAAGRRVRVLRDGEAAAGAHRESYSLRDAAGRDLASGLYLVRLEAEGRVITRRVAAIH